VTLWRISKSRSLSGEGGLIASGRWHTKGCRVVYCAENPATALVEVLTHFEIDPEDQPVGLRWLEIEVPDLLSIETARIRGDWRQNLARTRAVGDEWLLSGRSVLLRVPSVLAPRTWNVLINPQHHDATAIKLVRSHRHALDPRLIR
jgi:RES domain-containing protein